MEWGNQVQSLCRTSCEIVYVEQNSQKITVDSPEICNRLVQ